MLRLSMQSMDQSCKVNESLTSRTSKITIDTVACSLFAPQWPTTWCSWRSGWCRRQPCSPASERVGRLTAWRSWHGLALENHGSPNGIPMISTVKWWYWLLVYSDLWKFIMLHQVLPWENPAVSSQVAVFFQWLLAVNGWWFVQNVGWLVDQKVSGCKVTRSLNWTQA